MNIKQKELYKFKAILDLGDEADLLELVEDRGDRGLFRSVVYCADWRFRPTAVYLMDDVIKVTELGDKP